MLWVINMILLREFDLQSKEKTGGVTGSTKVQLRSGGSYQLKPSILDAKLYRQLKANQTDHENLGEVIAASIAQKILGPMRAPKVSTVYDDENKKILVASKYLDQVVGTLDVYGMEHYLTDQAPVRHIKIVTENPDKTRGEIAWSELPQTVRDTLAEAVVASAIVGDHDINPGNMMVLTGDGEALYEVARIDFGHAFNDLIHASSAFNGGLHDADNPVFDFLNRTHLAGLFKRSEQSKLWRDYPGLMNSQELMNALLTIGNMDISKIEEGSEDAKKEFMALIQLLQRQGDTDSLAHVLNALKHIYHAISSHVLEDIHRNGEDAYVEHLVTTVFDEIKAYCKKNALNSKKAGETLGIQMTIDEAIKAKTDIVISELPRFDWLNPTSQLAWLNLDGETEGFHGTIEAYVRHRNEQLEGNSLCIATRSNPEAEKTYKKQLKQLRVMSEFCKTEQSLLRSIENSTSLLVSSEIASYEEKLRITIDQCRSVLTLSAGVMDKFTEISVCSDDLLQRIFSDASNESPTYAEDCASLVNEFNECYLSEKSRCYLDNLLVLASSTQMLQLFLNKLSPYRYRLERESIDGQTISSYMMAPVQRFPRYRLLFEELGKSDPSIQPSINQAKEYSTNLNQLLAIKSGSLKATLCIDSAKKMYGEADMPAYVLNCIASCPMIASEKTMLINERNAWIRTLLLHAYPTLFQMNDMRFIVLGADKEKIEAALGITQETPDFCPNRFNHDGLEALYQEKNEPLWRVLKAIQPVELTKEGCPAPVVLEMFSQAREDVENCFDTHPEFRLGMNNTEFYGRQYDRLNAADGFVKKHSKDIHPLDSRLKERLNISSGKTQESLLTINDSQKDKIEARLENRGDNALGVAFRKLLESEIGADNKMFFSSTEAETVNAKISYLLSLYPDLLMTSPLSEEDSNKQARVRRALGGRIFEGMLFVDVEQFDYSALLELYQDDHNPLWLVLASSVALITPLDVRTVFEDQQYIKPSIDFKAKVEIYLQIAVLFKRGANIVFTGQDAIRCPTVHKAHKGAYEMLCLAYDVAAISKDPELVRMVQDSCVGDLGSWIKDAAGFETSMDAVQSPGLRASQEEIMSESRGALGKQIEAKATRVMANATKGVEKGVEKVTQHFRKFFTLNREEKKQDQDQDQKQPKR